MPRLPGLGPGKRQALPADPAKKRCSVRGFRKGGRKRQRLPLGTPVALESPTDAFSSATRSQVSANHLDSRWDQVVRDFRQFCVLRRQERRADSELILRQSLPQSIAEWSKHDTDNAGVKKARLDAMFQQEQRRIEDACLLNELLSAQLKHEFLPVLCSSVSAIVGEELRRAGIDRDSDQRPARREPQVPAEPAPRSRVAFDDIPSVIDLLLDNDRPSPRRRQLVPN